MSGREEKKIERDKERQGNWLRREGKGNREASKQIRKERED